VAFTVAVRNAALDNVGAQGSWVSLHTADPGTTGASEVTGGSYARVQTTWSAAANGSKAGSQVTINVPSGVTVAYFGVWSASAAGTFCFGGSLAASQAFSSAGTYQLTVTITD
jgi:hypothetical protein